MTKTKAENRFLAMPRWQQALVLVGFLVGLLACLELASYGLFVVYYRVLGNDTMTFDELLLTHFHPLFRDIDFRTFKPESEYDPYYLFRPIPNLPPSDDEHRLITDRHGFVVNSTAKAGRDLTAPKKRFRIFLFGGSTVMGDGPTRNLAAYLERALEKVRPRTFEVINAGSSGFSSIQELIRFLTDAVYLQPDMIVTFDGVNDIGVPMYLKEYRRNRSHYTQWDKAIIETEEERSFNEPITIRREALINWFRRFYTVELVFKALRRFGVRNNIYQIRDDRMRGQYFNYDRDPIFRPEALHAYIENLVSLDGAAAARGIASLHLLQPTLGIELQARNFDVEDAVKSTFAKPFYLAKSDSRKRAEVLTRFFLGAADQFKALDAKAGPLSAWKDLSRLFRNVDDLSTIYIDYVHYRDSAHPALAAAIVPQVLDLWRRSTLPATK